MKLYIKDDENSIMWNPQSYNGNKFFGTWNKALMIDMLLLREDREKYTNRYGARLKAEVETQSIPVCFDKCVHDFENNLNSKEKNCMRDCVLKRISSRDDFQILMQQKLAVENVKAMRERFV